jgi:CRP-like cAMP-binding protein
MNGRTRWEGPGSRPTVDDVAALRRCVIFQDVLEEDLEILVLAAESRIYGRGEQIAPEVDGRRPVYALTGGGARLSSVSATGREFTVMECTAGDLLGLMFLDPEVRACNAITATMDDTMVYCFSVDCFRQFLVLHPDAAVSALGVLGRQLADMSENLTDLALHDAKTRLAHNLARLARGNEHRQVSATHAELAALVGTAPERVTKLLGTLRKEKLVIYEPHQHGIVVPDPDQLCLAAADNG